MGVNKYNKYIIEKTKLEEYKDLLFKEKCVRHERKRIQSKSYNLGIYKFIHHALMIKDIYSMMGTKHFHMALRIFVSYIKIIQKN